MNAKISVIIPVYNVEKYLRRCLDSVINQTYKNLEIICIDDGSTDNSNIILQNFVNKDCRIIIYTQSNKGAGYARNVGLKRATGKYIVFIDPDDFYPDNNVLLDLYNAAETNNVKIAGGGLIEFLPDNRYRMEYKKNDPKIFKENKFILYNAYQYDYFFQRFIYLKSFLLENNIFFSQHRRQQDIIFFVTAMIYAKYFYALSRRTYCYRIEYKFNKMDMGKALDAIDLTKALLILSKKNNLNVLHNRIYKRYLFQNIEMLLIKIKLGKIQIFIKKCIFKLRFKLFLDKYFKN